MRRPLHRSDRGATLVEYALIVALVVVGSLAAIQFLTTQSEAEVANQADCVSTRPPPPSCQARAVTTSTTAVPPETTTTVAPETTTTTEATTTTTSSTTTSTTTPPSPFNFTLTGSTQNYFGFLWRATGSIYVTDPAGAPARNVTVVMSLLETGQTTPTSVSCVTAASGSTAGRCSVSSDWLWSNNVPSVVLTLVTAGGQPVSSTELTIGRP